MRPTVGWQTLIIIIIIIIINAEMYYPRRSGRISRLDKNIQNLDKTKQITKETK